MLKKLLYMILFALMIQPVMAQNTVGSETTITVLLVCEGGRTENAQLALKDGWTSPSHLELAMASATAYTPCKFPERSRRFFMNAYSASSARGVSFVDLVNQVINDASLVLKSEIEMALSEVSEESINDLIHGDAETKINFLSQTWLPEIILNSTSNYPLTVLFCEEKNYEMIAGIFRNTSFEKIGADTDFPARALCFAIENQVSGDEWAEFSNTKWLFDLILVITENSRNSDDVISKEEVDRYIFDSIVILLEDLLEGALPVALQCDIDRMETASRILEFSIALWLKDLESTDFDADAFAQVDYFNADALCNFANDLIDDKKVQPIEFEALLDASKGAMPGATPVEGRWYMGPEGAAYARAKDQFGKAELEVRVACEAGHVQMYLRDLVENRYLGNHRWLLIGDFNERFGASNKEEIELAEIELVDIGAKVFRMKNDGEIAALLLKAQDANRDFRVGISSSSLFGGALMPASGARIAIANALENCI